MLITTKHWSLPVQEQRMTSRSRSARIAGLLDLSLVLASPLRSIDIPATVIVRNDASAGRIAAHETLFRPGTVADHFLQNDLHFHCAGSLPVGQGTRRTL